VASTTAPGTQTRSPLRAELRRLASFGLVGLANTALSAALYTALVWAGVPYLIAGPAAFCAGALNGFLLNRRLTFRRAGSLPRYVVVQGAAAVSTDLLLALVGEGTIAYVGATVLVSLAAFLAARLWVFAE